MPCVCVCAVQYTREVDMMSHLPDHPNILKLLGACTAPHKLILVMQHCSRYVASVLQVVVCCLERQSMTLAHSTAVTAVFANCIQEIDCQPL